jgi:hypothetical protein
VLRDSELRFSCKRVFERCDLCHLLILSRVDYDHLDEFSQKAVGCMGTEAGVRGTTVGLTTDVRGTSGGLRRRKTGTFLENGAL